MIARCGVVAAGVVGCFRFRLCLTVVAAVSMGGAGMASMARAECPNAALRAHGVSTLRLPDCRAYEQVSPVHKNLTDALGGPSAVQSSLLGDRVTFTSVSPLPGIAGAPTDAPSYMSTFGDDEWMTQGLAAPAEPDTVLGTEKEAEVLGWSRDLSRSVIAAEEPLLTSEPVVIEGEGSVEAVAGQRNFYVRSDTAPVSYRLLAPGPGTVYFVAATPTGSRILFEDDQRLTADAAGPGCEGSKACPHGVFNLYEWNEGQISLAGALQNGHAPAQGATPGPGGPLIRAERGAEHQADGSDEFYTQGTLNEEGTRVDFSDVETGSIYMRENGETTVKVSGAGPAYWRAATPDGRDVFYTEAENLYRFDAEGEVREPITSGAADVQGTFGVSADGSYVYFVAKGVLNSNGATVGQVDDKHVDLYEWHEGVTTLVASLGTAGDEESDWLGYADLRAEPDGSAGGEKSSHVSPSGTGVLFSSTESLTGYENRGNRELYLFDPVGGGGLTCVSCNPARTPASSSAYLETFEDVTILAVVYPFTTSNLSDDGERVFFQTAEALVPQDSNGVADVYEWEREGSGSCAVGGGNGSGGCLSLISTGQSASPSYFGDASADGGDVFFFTRQSLVGQDQDENQDLYDAREGGGLEAQSPPLPAACLGEACRGAPVVPPLLSVPSSATFSGPGNLPPAPESAPAIEAKPLNQAQRLAKSLKACERDRSKKKRAGCRSDARRRYGGAAAAKASQAREPDRGHRS